MTLAVRGIRGAISVDKNNRQEIIMETQHLLQEIVKKNNINHEDVCSIFFSVTTDLTSEFPAIAARKLGFSHTPLLCLTEIPVQGSLARVVRILVHWNTDIPQKDMVHVYLKDATSLRPDLSENSKK